MVFIILCVLLLRDSRNYFIDNELLGLSICVDPIRNISLNLPLNNNFGIGFPNWISRPYNHLLKILGDLVES